MTGSLLLDTHIVIWFWGGDSQLRNSTRNRIERFRAAGGHLLISAVTAWEVAFQAERGRIDLGLPVDQWLAGLLAEGGVKEMPVNARIGVKAYQIPGLAHGDPADRLLIATAIDQDCPLLTYDRTILRFAREHGASRGFSVLC